MIQVYAALPEADAHDRLVGFTRVEVGAGAAAPFAIRIPVTRLATRNAAAHAWRPASGVHAITVARNAADPDAVTNEIDIRVVQEFPTS